jgi:hypothetical protein
MLRCDRVLSKVSGQMVATMTARVFCAGALVLVLLPGPSAAQQAPVVKSVGVPSETLPEWLRDKREVVPDTTAPWRYHPLAVGNVWEYDVLYSSVAGRVVRVSITGDTLIDGNYYFDRGHDLFEPNGEHAGRWRSFIRYDTVTTHLKHHNGLYEGDDPWNPCPLGAYFDSVARCSDGHMEFGVRGGHDGTLSVFPDMGEMTYKIFGEYQDEELRYVADLGLIMHVFYGRPAGKLASAISGPSVFGASTGGWMPPWRIRYVRVNGVEHGTPLYPLADEPEPSRVDETLSIEVYPNPSYGKARVRYDLPASADLEIEVFDVLGRSLMRRSLGLRQAGQHEEEIDLSGLPVGTYMVRMSTHPRNGHFSVTVVVSTV